MKWSLFFFLILSVKAKALTCNSVLGNPTKAAKVSFERISLSSLQQLSPVQSFEYKGQKYLLLNLQELSKNSPEGDLAWELINQHLVEAFEEKLKLPMPFLNAIAQTNEQIFSRMTLILAVEGEQVTGSIALTEAGAHIGELPLQIEQRLLGHVQSDQLEFKKGYEIGRLQAKNMGQLQDLIAVAYHLIREERQQNIPIYFLTNESHIRLYQDMGYHLKKLFMVNVNANARKANPDYVVQVISEK